MKNFRIHSATEDEIWHFKDRVTKILAGKGLAIDHPVALERLKKAGASIGSDKRVRFPKALQEEALRCAPRKFLIAGMEEKYDVPIPHPEGLFYARGPIGQMHYIDALTGEYRENTMSDQLDYIKVQQGCDQMSLWGNFTVKAEGFPSAAMDVHTADLCMRHCAKPAYWMPYGAESVRYVVEMAQVIAGGKEQLTKRPFLTLMCCSATPLGINYMDCEQILQAADNKLPLHCTSLPTAGANAPITPGGLALMSTAEAVGQAVVAQLLGPGTPVLLSAFTYMMDMRSMHTLISGVEMNLSRLLAVQVIEEGYGLPCHTFNGGSNSHTLDAQVIADDAMSTQLMALSGATMMGDLGALETCMIASPIQMIIDNDLVAMAKRLKRGIVVDDEELAFKAVMELDGREPFISKEHTLEHYTEIIYPRTFTRDTRPGWIKEGGLDMFDRAREEYKRMIAQHKPIAHPPEILRELDRIVARADKEIRK